MSLKLCIPGMVERGEISPERGAEMARIYGELELAYRRQMSPAAAAAAASEGTLKQLEQAALLKKRQALLQVQAQKSSLLAIASYDGGKGIGGGGKGPIDPRAAEALFDQDGRAGYSNVEARRKAIRGRAHSMLDQMLARYRRTVTGQLRNAAEMPALVRALFGEAIDDVNVREIAESWGKASDMLRARFNAAGGAIGKMERWGLPQSHDSRAVRQAGFTQWRDFIAPKLDRARMIDETTGMPFTDGALELALRDVFETIRTDGWSKITPGGVGKGMKTASRHAEHRFLHFASADDWLAYNERFGQGGPFDAMMSHIDAMSRDIAAMEILGPNPDATVRWLQDQVQKSAALVGDDAGKASDAATAGASRMQRLWNEYTGELRRPESRRIALGFSAVRSWQTAAKLGSATLSAVTDVGFQAFTRRFNGLPAVSVLGDYLKLLRPGAEADRRLAVRMGLIAEEWANHVSSQHRYLGEELAGEFSRRLAETTLRVSGLSHWTQAGRWAFGMEFLGHLTDQVGKSFDALDAPLRDAMQRYGIGADGWERIRATPLKQERGAEWLMPGDIADRELGDRLLEMIQTETDFAVPTPDLRTRSIMHSVGKAGTWWGETVRTATQFKGFGISILLMHGRRMLEQQGAWSRAGYAAGLMIPLTLMGGLALQLKEIAKGKDPRPVWDEDDPGATATFWSAAMLQGGGFGIFGDFLSASTNRFGGGFGETLAGPTIGLVSDVGQASIGNVARAADGKDTRFGADALRIAKGEIPVATSLWYTRLAFERLAVDQIQREIDPNYRQSWRRMEKRARDAGQDYYWEPGETAPDRSPDLEAMFEGDQP